jgi:hypothetical protein
MCLGRSSASLTLGSLTVACVDENLPDMSPQSELNIVNTGLSPLEHPAVIESYLGTDGSTIHRSGTRV